MSKIILVTGGARSGKSTFAEKLSNKINDDKKVYIATAQILDDEMAHRVKMHKSRRNESWVTIESPFNAEIAIKKAADISNLILFDCLTIYISNILCKFENFEEMSKIDIEMKNDIDKLIGAAKNFNGTIIFVTNEVGGGIVPENKLARIFRDFSGIINQRIAKIADEVYLVVAGFAVDIKKIAYNLE